MLLIAAIGGASSQGLGIPMMIAFIVGLLISNSIVVLITVVLYTAYIFGLDSLFGVVSGWLYDR